MPWRCEADRLDAFPRRKPARRLVILRGLIVRLAGEPKQFELDPTKRSARAKRLVDMAYRFGETCDSGVKIRSAVRKSRRVGRRLTRGDEQALHDISEMDLDQRLAPPHHGPRVDKLTPDR